MHPEGCGIGKRGLYLFDFGVGDHIEFDWLPGGFRLHL